MPWCSPGSSVLISFKAKIHLLLAVSCTSVLCFPKQSWISFCSLFQWRCHIGIWTWLGWERKSTLYLCWTDGTWWHHLVMGSVGLGIFSRSVMYSRSRIYKWGAAGLHLVDDSAAPERSCVCSMAVCEPEPRRNHPALHRLLKLPPDACWQGQVPARPSVFG